MAAPALSTVGLPSDVLDVVDGPDVEPVADPLPVLAMGIAGPHQVVVAGRAPNVELVDAPNMRAYCSTLDSSTARTHTSTITKGQQEMMDATLTRRIGYRKANEQFQGQTNL